MKERTKEGKIVLYTVGAEQGAKGPTCEVSCMSCVTWNDSYRGGEHLRHRPAKGGRSVSSTARFEVRRVRREGNLRGRGRGVDRVETTRTWAPESITWLAVLFKLSQRG